MPILNFSLISRWSIQVLPTPSNTSRPRDARLRRDSICYMLPHSLRSVLRPRALSVSGIGPASPPGTGVEATAFCFPGQDDGLLPSPPWVDGMPPSRLRNDTILRLKVSLRLHTCMLAGFYKNRPHSNDSHASPRDERLIPSHFRRFCHSRMPIFAIGKIARPIISPRPGWRNFKTPLMCKLTDAHAFTPRAFLTFGTSAGGLMPRCRWLVLSSRPASRHSLVLVAIQYTNAGTDIIVTKLAGLGRAHLQTRRRRPLASPKSAHWFIISAPRHLLFHGYRARHYALSDCAGRPACTIWRFISSRFFSLTQQRTKSILRRWASRHTTFHRVTRHDAYYAAFHIYYFSPPPFCLWRAHGRSVVTLSPFHAFFPTHHSHARPAALFERAWFPWHISLVTSISRYFRFFVISQKSSKAFQAPSRRRRDARGNATKSNAYHMIHHDYTAGRNRDEAFSSTTSSFIIAIAAHAIDIAWGLFTIMPALPSSNSSGKIMTYRRALHHHARQNSYSTGGYWRRLTRRITTASASHT